ncbi:hypothetical protein BDW74DRAFT_151876 [Aspergillus multicolor]|uniref:uncharacterized protein n=1 Tax=Aspergillus multicolor TaxID=41759 RepID=UPI003CCCD912
MSLPIMLSLVASSVYSSSRSLPRSSIWASASIVNVFFSSSCRASLIPSLVLFILKMGLISSALPGPASRFAERSSLYSISQSLLWAEPSKIKTRQKEKSDEEK